MRAIGCAFLLWFAGGAALGAGDPVLARIARLVRESPGWSLRTGGAELVIERSQSVWVLDTNLISAPASKESEAEREARIKRHGRRARPRIVFRIEPRWSDARLAAARRTNALLATELAALGPKHRVEPLLRAARARKNPDPALGASAEERTRLAAYDADRVRLEARKVRVPDYQTTSSSLSFLRHEAWSDAYHLIHPFAATEECYRLDRKIRELLLPSR